MNKLRTRIFAASFVGIIILASINVYAELNIKKTTDNIVKQNSIKSSADKMLLISSYIKNILDYSLDETEKFEETKAEYNQLVEQFNEELTIVKASKISEDNTRNVSKNFEELVGVSEEVFSVVGQYKLIEREYNENVAQLQKISNDLKELVGDSSSKRGQLVSRIQIEEDEVVYGNFTKAFISEWRELIDQIRKTLSPSRDALILKKLDEYSLFVEKIINNKIAMDDFLADTDFHATVAGNAVSDLSIYSNKIRDIAEVKINAALLSNRLQMIYIFGGVALAFALSLFIAYFVFKNIFYPIDELTKVAEKVSVGELKLRVKVRTTDEIGYLSKVFNDMLDVIERFNAEVSKNKETLRAVNADLERKVNERTSELEGIKNNLEKMVEGRTKELKLKIDELERFRDLTIGRELKMINMKKEIEELKQKLG